MKNRAGGHRRQREAADKQIHSNCANGFINNGTLKHTPPENKTVYLFMRRTSGDMDCFSIAADLITRPCCDAYEAHGTAMGREGGALLC